MDSNQTHVYIYCYNTIPLFILSICPDCEKITSKQSSESEDIVLSDRVGKLIILPKAARGPCVHAARQGPAIGHHFPGRTNQFRMHPEIGQEDHLNVP